MKKVSQGGRDPLTNEWVYSKREGPSLLRKKEKDGSASAGARKRRGGRGAWFESKGRRSTKSNVGQRGITATKGRKTTFGGIREGGSLRIRKKKKDVIRRIPIPGGVLTRRAIFEGKREGDSRKRGRLNWSKDNGPQKKEGPLFCSLLREVAQKEGRPTLTKKNKVTISSERKGKISGERTE